MKCPICKQNEIYNDGRDALSRKDNKTSICTSCSINEAMEEYNKWREENE